MVIPNNVYPHMVTLYFLKNNKIQDKNYCPIPINFFKIPKNFKIFKYEIQLAIRTNSKRTILICKMNT